MPSSSSTARVIETKSAGLSVVSRKEGALLRGLLDGAVDIAGRHHGSAADAVIEAFEHATGLLGRFGRAAHDDLIAVGMGHDAEPPFDMREILVVLTEDEAREPVVFESEPDFRGFREAVACGTGEA